MKSRKFGRLTIITAGVHSHALLVAGDLLLQQLVHAVHHVSHFRVLSPGLREGKDTDDGDWIEGFTPCTEPTCKTQKGPISEMGGTPIDRSFYRSRQRLPAGKTPLWYPQPSLEPGLRYYFLFLELAFLGVRPLN